MEQTSTTSGRTDPTALTPGVLGVLLSRVHWLVRLRWFYAAVLVLVGLVSWAAWEGPNRYGAHAWSQSPASQWLWTLAAMTLIHNALVWLGLGHCQRLSHVQAGRFLRFITDWQIAVDVVMLAVLLYAGFYPAVVVTVFHMAVAASLLPGRDAYLQAVAASLANAAAMLALWIPRALHRPEGGWAAPGRMFWLELSYLAVAWAVLAGVLVLAVWFTQSILGRLRRTNARLRQANLELSALDLTKSRFLRLASHHLRGPLAAVDSLLGAIATTGPMNAAQEQLRGRIGSRLRQIFAQLDEMMLLSTIREKGVETSARRPVDVGQVVARTVTAWSAEAERRGLEFQVDQNGHPLYVQAWANAVETVLDNLVSNAVKYTPGSGTVTVACRQKDRRVQVEVADTGIGIPSRQQDQLFHEFFRGINARQVADGTGLGLCIVQAVVEQLGGDISIASTQDAGTRVTVSWPAAEADEAPKATEAPAVATESPAAGTAKAAGAAARAQP